MKRLLLALTALITVACSVGPAKFLVHPLPPLPMTSSSVVRSGYEISAVRLTNADDVVSALGIRALRLGPPYVVVQLRVMRLDSALRFPADGVHLKVNDRQAVPLPPDELLDWVSLPVEFQIPAGPPATSSQLNTWIESTRSIKYREQARQTVLARSTMLATPPIGEPIDLVQVFRLEPGEAAGPAPETLLLDLEIDGKTSRSRIRLETR